MENGGVIDTPSVTVWATADDAERRRILTRNGTLQTLTAAGELNASIGRLLDEVREKGDAALVAALSSFDGVETTAEGLRVTEDDFARARVAVSEELLAAIRYAIARSTAFNMEIVRRATWSVATEGSLVGEVGRPLESVGLFVPSGKGSFPSVMVQIGCAAVAAAVPRIVVVLPPAPGGTGVDPATLIVAEELGLNEVYRLNGPSGIGALAFGTESVPRVRKIVGPGSPAVTVAQQLVQTTGCLVASGLGPTDSLIIADQTADVTMLAADLINEAEHGADSSAVLISTDRSLLEQVAGEASTQLARLPEPRQGYARRSILENGGLVLAADRPEALRIANDYASEHVQLAVSDPDSWLEEINYAGTVLLGQWTTFAASNFVIGTPATLPTTQFAKAVSGVTAHTYLNAIATARVTENGFWGFADHIEAFAHHEGFPAHLASVAVRRGLRA